MEEFSNFYSLPYNTLLKIMVKAPKLICELLLWHSYNIFLFANDTKDPIEPTEHFFHILKPVLSCSQSKFQIIINSKKQFLFGLIMNWIFPTQSIIRREFVFIIFFNQFAQCYDP